VGLKKEPPQLSREQAMLAMPVHNPSLKWKLNDEGNVVVIMPRRDDLSGKTLGWLFGVPQEKPVELDELGSSVWQRCDGDHTVAEIVTLLCREHKLSRHEVEITLTEYLRTLGKRGMVGFMVPREVAEAAGVAHQEVIGLEDVATTREQLTAAQEQAAREAAETERILAELEEDDGDSSVADPDVADETDTSSETDDDTDNGVRR
jgi:hypothetical protein